MKTCILFRLVGRRALLASCLGLPPIAAQAPAPPATEQQTIVVQGERLAREAARERAVAFVRTTGVASGETPTARWVDPICPDVVGLVDTAERAAEARIRRIAAAVGVKLAPEGCVRNIVVSFAPDGAAVAREIARRDPGRMAQLSPSARAAVLTGSAPIRWWYTTEIRSRHNAQGGDGMAGAGGTGQTSPGSGYGQALGGNGGGLMHYESSILSTLTTRVLTSAIVVVDQDQVMGRRLDSLAAYAALVALAEIRGVGAAPEGSILNLFASPGAMRDLTAQDMAFLRALYRLPLDRQAMQHRGVLVGAIADALAGAD